MNHDAKPPTHPDTMARPASRRRHRGQDALGATQELEREVIALLSTRTRAATLSVQQVMGLSDCGEARARRVIARLVDRAMLAPRQTDLYDVI